CTWGAAAQRADAEYLAVSREAGEGWTDAVLAALDERVAIVSVPNVHWTDGALLDMNAIAQRTREVGAALVIDGSQSVGAMPISVADLRADYLAKRLDDVEGSRLSHDELPTSQPQPLGFPIRQE